MEEDRVDFEERKEDGMDWDRRRSESCFGVRSNKVGVRLRLCCSVLAGGSDITEDVSLCACSMRRVLDSTIKLRLLAIGVG